MADPGEVVARLLDVPLAELRPDGLLVPELYRAASLMPWIALAARDAELRGVEWSDPGMLSILEAGRVATVAGVRENRDVIASVLAAFDGFQMVEHRSWIESLPGVRSALGFDLGVDEEKRIAFWGAVDGLMAHSPVRITDPDELQNLFVIDGFSSGGVHAAWAVLSPFNWTQFASDTAQICGVVALGAASATQTPFLLLPAGILMAAGAALKQMVE